MALEHRTPRSDTLVRVKQQATELGALDAGAAFGLFAAVVLAARVFADLAPGDIAAPWLLASAVSAAPLLPVAGLLVLAAIARWGRGTLFVTWADLDRGTALRRFTAVLLFLLAWRFLSAEYDFAYGRWWTLDRLALLGFAVVALRHPVALLAVVVQVRLLQAPIRSAFGFASGATLDDLPILALAAVGSIALLASITGRRSTHLVVPLLAASVVAQFFVSGRAKLTDGWLFDNDIANFPLNGYHQGWLGTGDGGFAEALSSFFATFRWPLLIGTLVIELGAIVMLSRRRSLIGVLCGFATFHLFVFLGYGFSFLEWAVVEAGLIALLVGAAGRTWSAPSFRLAPVALAVCFVVFGGVVFKPPTLAWFDGPITYRYEITAIDSEGTPSELSSQDFAPHESAVAFGFLHLGPTSPVAAGFGALNRERFDDLAEVSSWEALAELEDPLTDDWRTDRTIANLERFLLESGQTPSPFDWLPDAPVRYNTSRGGDAPSEDAVLTQLIVTRVTTMRVDGEALERAEPVVQLRRTDNGGVETTWSR